MFTNESFLLNLHAELHPLLTPCSNPTPPPTPPPRPWPLSNGSICFVPNQICSIAPFGRGFSVWGSGIHCVLFPSINPITHFMFFLLFFFPFALNQSLEIQHCFLCSQGSIFQPAGVETLDRTQSHWITLRWKALKPPSAIWCTSLKFLKKVFEVFSLILEIASSKMSFTRLSRSQSRS